MMALLTQAQPITIDIVISILRGLDNSITVAALSDRLNISTSTLNRTRNGKWPPSITFDSLRSAFYYYKANLFEDDDERIALAILNQLELMGVDSACFREKYESDGFEELVTALLLAASKSHESASGTTELDSKVAQDGAENGAAAEVRIEMKGGTALALEETQKSAKPESRQLTSTNIAIAVLIIGVLLVGSFSLDASEAFTWIFSHRVLFAGLAIAFALLPALLGIAIDAPICWHRYKTEHPEASFSWHSLSLVAKYGSESEVIPKRGRFDLGRRHLTYFITCNVLGAFCVIALLTTLYELPGFLDFITQHDWTAFFKVFVAIAFLVAYNHVMTQSLQPQMTHFDAMQENPDNFRFDRVHNIANIAYLTFIISLSGILTLYLFSYGISCPRVSPTPPGLAGATIAVLSFLYYSGLSSRAIASKSVSIGSSVGGIALGSVAVLVLSLTCFTLSMANVVIAFVTAVALTVTVLWLVHNSTGPLREWIRRCRVSVWYSIAFTLLVALFLVVCLGFS